MTVEKFLLFASITAVFMLSPGPSVILSIHNGVKYGVRRSSIGVLGNVFAFQVLVLLGSLGLGALIAASSQLFMIAKFVGALYLVYLGLKILVAPTTANSSQEVADSTAEKPPQLFTRAFLVTVSNPKALIYLSALLPQFIDRAQLLLPQLLILAATSALVQFIVFMVYVVLASNARRILARPRVRRNFNYASGITFVGFGAALGLSK